MQEPQKGGLPPKAYLPWALALVITLTLMVLSIRPVRALRALSAGRADAAAGQPLAAYAHLSEAASVFANRPELWEEAGWQALAGGELALALQAFERASLLGELTPQAQIAQGDAYAQLGNPAAAIQVWQAVLPASPDPEAVLLRLLDAHLAQNDYSQAVLDLQALIAARPGTAAYTFRLGLILTAIQPAQAGPYLEQAAALDRSLVAQTRTLRAAITAASLQDEPAFGFVSTGRALSQIGEWELAVEAFRQATGARPDYAEGWAFLGEACQHVASCADKALPALQTALAINSQSVAANSLLALYYQRQGLLEQAEPYLLTAAAADPNNPIWLAELGRVTAARGDMSTAAHYYQEAVALAPHKTQPWKWLAAFSIQNLVQVRELALPAARQAVLLDSNDPEALDLLGQALFTLEDFSGAERFFYQALEAGPEYAPAHLHLGMLHLVRSQPAEAYDRLLQAQALASDSGTAETAERLLQRYFP